MKDFSAPTIGLQREPILRPQP